MGAGTPWVRGDFDRPTLDVAQDLLGARLVRTVPGEAPQTVVLTETEAYVSGDPANHAFLGPNRKNWTMFTGPGHLYVYPIHRYFCANVTTRPGEAVLLRSAVPLPPLQARLGGPGLLCLALNLTRAQDGMDLVASEEVRVVRREGAPPRFRVTPRIGIHRHREAPLRFVIDEEWVGSRSR